MADLSKLIENKQESAQYMIDEITHICKDMPKRSPGTEGEKISCEYMAGVLKDCGCETADVESFKENPGSFFGWIYITVSLALASIVIYFFIPILSMVLICLGLTVMILEFGLYKKAVDIFFPELEGHNVTAFKKPTGEVTRRIIFNGHPDAAWNWPVNNKFGGKVYIAHILTSVIGAIYYLCLSIAAMVVLAYYGAPQVLVLGGNLMYAGIAGLIFVPGLIGMYFMWDEKTIVDGANDNLTGCYMGIAILKALKDQGIELEHTEIGVVLTGSEEAGLRGAKAWCEAHAGEFQDVPTFIYSYDTIHDGKFLMVNHRDLNGTVKSDREVGDLFKASADELGIHCDEGMVPPFGGATDNAAFSQAGFRSTGITALNHTLEDYYHTLRDTYDNLGKDCLADCYAVSVKVLEKFDSMEFDK